MRIAAIWATMLLAGCASQRSDYPSLAHRAVEEGGFDEPVRATPTLAPDPALDARIATMTTALTAAADGFAKALPAAEARAQAARGKPAGSDAWVTAQQTVSALDDNRAQLATLSTEVDDAASARAAALQPAYPGLDALGRRVDAELAHQRGEIDRLQAMLAPG